MTLWLWGEAVYHDRTHVELALHFMMTKSRDRKIKDWVLKSLRPTVLPWGPISFFLHFYCFLLSYSSIYILFLRFTFILFYIHVHRLDVYPYMGMCIWIHMLRENTSDSLGSRVTGGHDLPDMGGGSRTQACEEHPGSKLSQWAACHPSWSRAA